MGNWSPTHWHLWIAPIGCYWPGILPLTGMMYLRPGCMVRTIYRQLVTDTLAPVECTNWVLLAWNSTPDWNDVPSAWLYGQDHLWVTGHLWNSTPDRNDVPSSCGLYGQDHLWATGHLVSSSGVFSSSLPTHPSLSSHPFTPL